MNRLILLLIACVFQFTVFSQQAEKALKGQVKSVKLFSTGIKSDGSAIPLNTVLNSYDNNGEIVTSTTFRGTTDEQISSESYQYKGGQLLRKNEESKEESTFMGLTRPVKKKYYTYDVDGNLTEEKTVANGGDLTIKNNYNKSHQKIKTEVWNNGNLTSTIEYSYNKSNELAREEKKNASGKVYAETSYKYDAAGHKTESQSKEFDERKTYVSTESWKYDGDNEIEKIDKSEGQITTFTSVYNFDQQGNWITKKVFRNGAPWMEQRREITYR